MHSQKFLSATLLLVALTIDVSAKEQTLAETAVIGGAQGLIIGAAFVIYFFLWKPLKKKFDAAKRKKNILTNELTPLMVSAAEGNDAEVVRLIADGADVNACGKSGETALMMAAKNDRRAIVRLLLESGANVNAKTNKGNNARDIARQHKMLEVADILSEKMDEC